MRRRESSQKQANWSASPLPHASLGPRRVVNKTNRTRGGASIWAAAVFTGTRTVCFAGDQRPDGPGGAELKLMPGKMHQNMWW